MRRPAAIQLWTVVRETRRTSATSRTVSQSLTAQAASTAAMKRRMFSLNPLMLVHLP